MIDNQPIIVNERVDDIPVLLAQIEKMGNELFEIDIQIKQVEKIKRPYGERQKFTTVRESLFSLDFKINEDIVKQQVQLLG